MSASRVAGNGGLNLAQHIQDFCEDKARHGDGSFAVAFALLELSRAQERTATALKNLGLADATTPFGAIEALIIQMKETGETIARALERE
jgi:hypothetical protein